MFKQEPTAGVLRVDRRTPALKRVAMLSVHTSPLDQPGTGDAGGMNVYVVELSRELAAAGIAVDIFTRSTAGGMPPVVELADGVTVRHVIAGPLEGLAKSDLPSQLCTFAREVLRTEAVFAPGYYDLLHSHYWLSGQVGALARDRWGVPLVHSMHTMGKVKNTLLAEGDVAEPVARLIGEEQVVAAADLMIANTDEEARQLIELYDAEPDRVQVISPGVDLDIFTPGDVGESRARLGIAHDAFVVMFVGRIQPLKAPDVVIRAAADLLVRRPELQDRLVVPVIGGPSGSGRDTPAELVALAESLGLREVVRFVPRSRRPSSSTTTGRPRWCACRRTTSRSVWWLSRPKLAGLQWWRPGSVDSRRRSTMVPAESSSMATTPLTTAGRSSGCSRNRFWLPS